MILPNGSYQFSAFIAFIMDENAICLLLKDQSDAFTARLVAIQAELQETKNLLQVRHGGGGDSGSALPRAMRLDVPKFNVTDPDSWIFSITEYFALLNTPVDQRLKVVGFNLKGEAAEWFHWMARNKLITDWDGFVESVRHHFGPSKYEDPQGTLSKLLQTGTVAQVIKPADDATKKAQQNQNPEAGQTSMARDGSVFRYDPDYLREQFAGLVIQRALPFNHFDHEQTTRVFQNTMQPRYTHVSRSTLKRDAMKLWLAAKQEIIDSFGNINACVNLTTDVWSAPHGVPGSYMCVTAHWIEPGTWQMMKRVISFEEFPSPHTGGALFKMLTKVLTNFNLEDKVMSITLDNASNNTSAMDKLKLKYEPPMGGRFYHSRCVAHIINLVVQAGLEVPAIDAIRESFKTMLKDIFKSSARTRQRYVKICKDAEKPCLRPNWDVPTRWNSTYHMFLSGLKQQNTLAYFHDLLANKNRITWMDAKERKQDKCPLEILLDFEEDVFDDEVQRNEAIPLSDEEIALDASSEGTLSPRGPRYDYMMSSEAEDDY
ncbi:zinc finger BED domain-containing protein RICESLEEPER 2-like protein [Tanacetum coccineum]|uniref:Zinc finger BED domain-containing protein RICESLEEPER 2-like protein n=1 Tax=Tanacetum coccineum TaxID=301880 RepID=A0ABQ4XSJ2_9ASTR